MVWFQCEDCGENIKKPKLPNHFNICSAEKLSCIDCGEVFTKEDSQHHRECITESEKYGPKGEGHASNGTTTKPKGVNKNHLNVDFDINVGLSHQQPWICRFCKAIMTSRKTLLLHAEGKKHIAKARAFHASNSKQKSEAAAGVCCPNKSAVNENYRSTDLANSVNGNAQKVEEEEGHQSTKRRKTSQLEQGCDSGDNLTDSTVDKLGASEPEANHGNGMAAEFRMVKKNSSKPCSIGQNPINGIKWKKLITSYVKSSSDGVMKMKKLKKLVLKDLQGDSLANNEEQIFEFLEKKINSSSKLTLDGKMVHLVSKN